MNRSLCIVYLMVGSAVMADDKSPEASPSEPKFLTVSGTFEAVQSTELQADTKQLTSLKIKKLMSHGTAVKKGQTIVAFDTKDVDKRIKKESAELKLAEITAEAEEFALEQFREKQTLDKAAAVRTWQAAKQSYDNYQEVDRDRSVRSANFGLKSSQASLNNALEELKQLEQMYKEDGLTEESEEIVLKRAKQAAESAKYRYESAEISANRTLKQTLPRQVVEQEDRLKRAELTYELALRTLLDARLKKDIEMAQKRDSLREKQADFKKLQQERKSLVIVAPHDGIVYHGALSRGRLSDKPSTTKVGGSVTGKQTIATLVNPRRMQIRASLSETMMKNACVGQKGTASAAVGGSGKLNVAITKIGAIPYSSNKFDCVLSVNGGKGLIAGTGCTVKLPIAK